MQTVNIGSYCNRETAEELAEKLNGKTYMDFQTCIAPYNGMFNVWVETDYDATNNEVTGMLIGLLASMII